MNDINEKLSGLKTILHKTQEYCAYQERCKQDVLNKLYSWGVDNTRANKIIEVLINDNFINESRFASSFARGKFYHNKWGKIKITYELCLRKIDETLIQKGINEIPDTEYFAVIKTLIHKKSKEIKEKDKFLKNQKIARYLTARGFEPDIVFSLLHNK